MKINFETLTAKGNLINSLLSPEERAGNSALKYAVNKWNNRVQQLTKPIIDKTQKEFNEFSAKIQEQIKDVEEFIFISLSEKTDKLVCLKDEKGDYVLTAENLKKCKLQINEEIAPLKKMISDRNEELNKELLKQEVDFDPYLFIDQTRIKTFDLFAAEELLGIFIPVDSILNIPQDKINTNDLKTIQINEEAHGTNE